MELVEQLVVGGEIYGQRRREHRRVERNARLLFGSRLEVNNLDVVFR